MSPAELKFQEKMVNANDFFKIQLLRPAKKYYQEALELNINNEEVKLKIAECDRQIAYEVKVMKILAVITAVIIAVVYFLK